MGKITETKAFYEKSWKENTEVQEFLHQNDIEDTETESLCFVAGHIMWKAAHQGWQPIESAPKDGRTMYVVRGFGVTDKNVHCRNYTTDPYCVWPGDDGGWVRWPHAFPPTHWMPLPKPPTDQGEK